MLRNETAESPVGTPEPPKTMTTETGNKGFAAADETTARWAKALSHPARIAILRILAHHETCVCGEIVDGLPLAQSTVSQHLRVLRESGMIKGEVDGPRSCYCIDVDRVSQVLADLTRLTQDLEGANGCGC